MAKKDNTLLYLGAAAVGLLLLSKKSVGGINGYIRKVNKKYTHFAVRNSDNKILTGWETISDVESLKYYAKQDLIDMDVNPKDYKILSKSYLKNKGIDPFNWDNWILNNTN